MKTLANALPELTATGLAGAYMAWATATGAEVPINPFWLVAGAITGLIGLGLWRAYANDGKITPDEVAEILGVGRAQLDSALLKVREDEDAGAETPPDASAVISIHRSSSDDS